jgi:hypothetical protein
MKTIILSAIVICLMIGAPAAYAAQLSDAPFSKHPMAHIISGLAIGAQDAKDSCDHPDGCHWWILMRGHGFINQTQEFIRGYVHGFCSEPENALGGGSDAEQADIRCDKGPEAASWATPGTLDSNNTEFWTPPG